MLSSLNASSPDELTRHLGLFGKEAFRPMQEELIACALAGKSCVGVLPTGSGKSLCYQIPAVMLGKLTVVVSPLIALMRDQVEGLERLGIHCARYDSGLSDDEKKASLTKALNGEIVMLFVAPESLGGDAVRHVIDNAPLGLFVIDEAHCVSEWGHSFRPDYLTLPEFARTHSFHAVMALTATATQRVRNDLASIFKVGQESVFALPPTRENIAREVLCLPNVNAGDMGNEQKTKRLIQILSKPDHTPAIVYATTRKETEELAARLIEQGVVCKSYHAGMPTDVRAVVQDEFFTGKVPVLVATIAFGMGIDKANVRSVIHYNMPSSPESYIQESGRAGRDGLPSLSVVLYHDSDYQAALNRIKANLPDLFSLEMLVTRLLSHGDNVISFYDTTTSCDVSEQALGIVLFHLENEGAIKTIAKGYKYYKVKPLFPMSTILGGRDEEETRLLSWLAENPDAEVEDLAVEAGLSWSQAVECLDDLGKSGEWKVTLRQRAVLVRSTGRANPAEAVKQCYEKFLAQARHDEERLAVCKGILLQQDCLNKTLDEYFGFPCDADCGHCGNCTSANARGESRECSANPGEKATPAIDDDVFAQIAALTGESRPALSHAGQLTRFLLGFMTPAAMKSRLWAHPLYGALSNHAWDEVFAVSYALLGK